ncbi:dephospho-CoA kinase [candidate division WOR-3 bacterium]|nr:dephospho-CoA kinase [candidate division WOR-3 bacterium]
MRPGARVVIGIGGNIATGKTTVANFFRELGATCIAADEVGWEVLPDITPALKKRFGEWIMFRSGCKIDKKKLRDLVFSDRAGLEYLNRISHPLLTQKIAARVDGLKSGIIVIDAALLFEWPEIAALCDHKILVTAHPKKTRGRVEAKGIGHGLFSKIRSMQKDNEEMMAQADFVIRNNGTLDELRGRCQLIYQRIKDDC